MLPGCKVLFLAIFSIVGCTGNVNCLCVHITLQEADTLTNQLESFYSYI